MNLIQFSALYNVYLNPETVSKVRERLDVVADKTTDAKGDRWAYFRDAQQDLLEGPMLAGNRIENQVSIRLNDERDVLTLQTNQSPHARPHDRELLLDDFMSKVFDDAESLDKLAEQFPDDTFEDTARLTLGGFWTILPEAVQGNPNQYVGDYLILNQYIEEQNWKFFEALLSHPEFDPNVVLKQGGRYPILTSSTLIKDVQYNEYFKALYDHPATDFKFKDSHGDTLYSWVKKQKNSELVAYLEAKGIHE